MVVVVDVVVAGATEVVVVVVLGKTEVGAGDSEVSGEEEVVGSAEVGVEVVVAVVLVVVSAAAVSGVVVVARGDAVAEGVSVVVERLSGAMVFSSESTPLDEHAEMSNIVAIKETTIVWGFALKYSISVILILK